MAMYAKSPQPASESQTDALIRFGLVVEYLLPPPYQRIPMTEVIAAIVLSDPSNHLHLELPPVNITALMTPIFGPFYNVTAAISALDEFLRLEEETRIGQTRMLIWFWVLNVVVLVTVGVRIYTRTMITKALRLYDWVAVLASASALVCGFMGIYAVHSWGLGRHIYYIPYEDVRHGARLTVIYAYLYLVGVGAIKISLIQFYLHLSMHKKFRRVCYVALSFVTITIILWIFILAFSCRPFDYWNHPFTTKCLPHLVLGYVVGGLQIVTDIITWVLPMPVVWALPLRAREKMIVVVTFGIGLLICIVSILRLCKFSTYLKLADSTYYTDVLALSVTEMDLAIIVSCIPAIKAFIVCYAPSLLLGSQKPSTENTLAHANDLELKPKPSAWEKLRKSGGIWSNSATPKDTVTSAGTALRTALCQGDIETGYKVYRLADASRDMGDGDATAGDKRSWDFLPGQVSPNYRSIEGSSTEDGMTGSSRSYEDSINNV